MYLTCLYSWVAYLNHSTREAADVVDSRGHEALTPFCQRGLHHMYRQHMNELLCTMYNVHNNVEVELDTRKSVVLFMCL